MSVAFWAGVLTAELAILLWLIVDEWLTLRRMRRINVAREQVALIYFDRIYRAAADESFWKALR